MPPLPSIGRPDRAHYDVDRRILVAEYGKRTVDLYCRGGICWPRRTATTSGARIEGYAVLLALDIRDRIAYAVEHTTFWSVDPWVDADTGRVDHEGLSPWLNGCWTHWYADTYARHEDAEQHRRFLRMVLASPLIAHPPYFPEVHWADDASADLTVDDWRENGRLYVTDGSDLQAAVNVYRVQPGREAPPAVHALRCAVADLEYRGYREPPRSSEGPVIVPVRAF